MIHNLRTSCLCAQAEHDSNQGPIKARPAFGARALWQVASVVTMFAATSPVGAATYTFTDLGTLGGGATSYAKGINSAGQVVGFSDAGDGAFHAVVWNGTTATDLGRGSRGYAINDAGQVVGDGNTVIGITNLHATRWNGTTATDLGTLGGSFSEALAINSAGQVAGSSTLTGDVGGLRAIRWNGTTATSLGTLGGSYSSAFGINGAGQVVGYSSLTGDTSEHATL